MITIILNDRVYFPSKIPTMSSPFSEHEWFMDLETNCSAKVDHREKEASIVC